MSRLFVLGVALLLSAPARRSDAAEPATVPQESAEARPAPESSGVAAAKENYEAGVNAYQHGRHEDAIRFFMEADRLAPSAPLSFNIARVYEKMGNGAQAFRYYRDYLRRAPGAANAADVEQIVKKYQEELASRGRQQLCVLSTPPGATATLNGNEVGRTPWTGELEPGVYRVELAAPGFLPVTRDVTLALSQAEDVIVTLDAVRAEPAPATEPARPAANVPRDASSNAKEPAAERGTDFGPWPWLAIGAGGAALGGALVFEVLRDASEDAARREPRQIAFSEKLDQMNGRKYAARVLLASGSALVLTGGVLILLEEFGGESGSAVHVGVSVEPRAASAALSGAF